MKEREEQLKKVQIYFISLKSPTTKSLGGTGKTGIQQEDIANWLGNEQQLHILLLNGIKNLSTTQSQPKLM